jgi:hypothetical protein
VKIYLPRVFVETGEDEGAPELPGPPAGSRDAVILLVEDDDRMRQIAVAGLRELG